MRLAAIDVGSNSGHMVIADVRRDGHFEVIDRVKEMVRLGRTMFTSGTVARERVARGRGSRPLGGARLTERFLTTDPPEPAAVRRLEDHLHRKLDALLRKARRSGVVRAIGTSGTINALVAMARVARDGEQDRLHGLSIPATDVTWLRNRLLKLSADERAELPGADPKRADLMPAAAILADFVLEHAG